MSGVIFNISSDLEERTHKLDLPLSIIPNLTPSNNIQYQSNIITFLEWELKSKELNHVLSLQNLFMVTRKPHKINQLDKVQTYLFKPIRDDA